MLCVLILDISGGSRLFKVGSERQIFWETFHGSFNLLSCPLFNTCASKIIDSLNTRQCLIWHSLVSMPKLSYNCHCWRAPLARQVLIENIIVFCLAFVKSIACCVAFFQSSYTKKVNMNTISFDALSRAGLSYFETKNSPTLQALLF